MRLPVRDCRRRLSAEAAGGGVDCGGLTLALMLLLPAWTILTCSRQVSGQSYSPGFRRADQKQPTMSTFAFAMFISQDRRELCRNLRFADNRIGAFCDRNDPIEQKLHDGLRRGYKMCQMMFRKERWNCTFRPSFLDSGYSHAGFVWALTTSSAVTELLLACKTAEFSRHCQCVKRGEITTPSASSSSSSRPKRSPDSQMSINSLNEYYSRTTMKVRQICDDNVGQAVKWVKNFLGDEWNSQEQLDLLHRVNMHNRRAGAMAVRRSRVRKCMCIGMSGSCSTQICTKSVQRSGKVERHLLSMLRTAKLAADSSVLDSRSRQLKRRISNRRRRKNKKKRRRKAKKSSALDLFYAKGKRVRRIPRKRLAYLSRSPSDYCEQEAENGLLGVAGRICNATDPDASDFCMRLCCGSGRFRSQAISQKKFCNCRMEKNPIRVVCDTCINKVIMHSCTDPMVAGILT